jgi:hypothetical protein
MTSLVNILYAEALCVMVAGVMVTPLAIANVFMRSRWPWAGVWTYVKCACWGGALLFAAEAAFVIAQSR